MKDTIICHEGLLMMQMKLHTPHISVCSARNPTQDIKMFFETISKYKLNANRKPNLCDTNDFGKHLYNTSIGKYTQFRTNICMKK